MNNRHFYYLSCTVAMLAFMVVVLGAYVRLSDAGLGCPDWPGCYGRIVPESQIAAAQAHDPNALGKAWKEMIHRYFAGTLGLLIAAMLVWAWRKRITGLPFKLVAVLVVLVVFQALLGMWTVTLRLQPLIVMSHLLGGLTILSLLVWCALETRGDTSNPASQPDTSDIGSNGFFSHPGFWSIVLLALIAMQITLGGWTSANYAAVACPDFPLCQNAWLPSLSWSEGFSLPDLNHAYGQTTYEGGAMSLAGRTAVHWTHRIGAVVIVFAAILIGLGLWRKFGMNAPAGRSAVMVAAAGLLQFTLGVCMVVYQFPLVLATAHNAVAALLLASVVALNHGVFRSS